MKTKYYYLIIILLLFTFNFNSKVEAQSFKCGTTEAQEKLYEKYPELRQQQQEFNNYVRNYVAEHYLEANRNIITIPIVFHIVHNYGAENISDAQILEQVEILNRDFNMLNEDTSDVIPEFKSLIANVGIEFKLAQRDPQGNCTNGIDRIASPLTYLGNDAAKLNPWDRRKYLNVWTVNQMEDGVAGYAYYPQSVSGINFPVDGIIILHSYIGASGTSNPNRSRALTHEIGHWINLAHPWGDNNNPGQACGDDGISDTPLTRGWTNCPLPANSAVCTPGVKENYQNYMDYSYCSVMFTHGQKQAMFAALNSDVSFRNNLWTNENLIATGVLNPTICAPVADFFTNSKFICVGGSVNFRDNSQKSEPTSWSWTFSGGTPASSNAKNPSVSYQTPGIYPVSLTVSNAAGTSSLTKEAYIVVSPNWSDYTSNHAESFEDAALVERWFKFNPSNNAKQWQRVEDVGATGNSSLMLNGFSQAEGDVDELISPSYDLRYMTNLNVNFKYIGASQATNISDLKDSLTVYVSTDCGRSWGTPRLRLTRANLIKAGHINGIYKPSPNDNWTTASFNLNSAFAVANVRFRFRYTSGTLTNNFFIDDFNINGVVSVEELEGNAFQLDVIPNPFQEEAIINLKVAKAEKVMIDLYDITGRLVLSVFNGSQSESSVNYELERQNLTNGIYIIRAQIGDQSSFKKVVIE
jgi:PKD repeat protein